MSGDLANAEVAFIEAPAAVGKTTLVRYISSERRAPLLDLARAAPGADTLAGSLSMLGPQALQRLQAGQLAVLVDALDEGLIRSGVWNFDEFIRTSALVVDAAERHPGTLSLVLFGRPPAIADAKAGFELYATHVPLIHLKIDFFDEAGARRLVQQRANVSQAGVNRVLDEYFGAIARALRLNGRLWHEEVGRGFAGYAPLLDTLGYICARENLANLANSFAAQNSQEAWAVLEKVLNDWPAPGSADSPSASSLILRERNEKFLPALRKRNWEEPPAWIYDQNEQFQYISQCVRNAPYQISNRGQISPREREIYRDMVELSVPTHPFIRERQFVNGVFAAVVAAYQICEVSAPTSQIAQIEQCARTPFLWRACRSFFMKRENLVDGELLGYVLASLWTDPQDAHVSISDAPEGGAQAEADGVRFSVTFPLRFIEVIGHGTSIRVSGDIVLGALSQSGSFELQRGIIISCRGLRVEEKLLRLQGTDISLNAESVEQPPNLSIVPPSSSQLGKDPLKFTVAGAFADRYPWSTTATEIIAADGEISDKWTTLIERCALKASAGALPVLQENGRPVDDDNTANWVRLPYEHEFPKLVTEITAAGLGKMVRISAGGSAKYRLRDVNWGDLLAAAKRPAKSSDGLRNLIGKLRGG
ncbi:MAG TPA: hypothetical protein VM755_05395 [Stellaceae bacterium]|nr:hypothetical protein [Stellaceae bacterium]